MNILLNEQILHLKLLYKFFSLRLLIQVALYIITLNNLIDILIIQKNNLIDN